MGDELMNDVQQLRQLIQALNERVGRLERAIQGRQPEPAVPAAVVQSPPSRPPIAAPPPARPVRPSGPPQENLELKIGRYWLNRIGIFSLVMGVAFFILYSFRYLGPFAKIGIGFSVGLSAPDAEQTAHRQAQCVCESQRLNGLA